VRGQSWRGRIRGVEGENKKGGAGWLSSLINLRWSRVVKFLNSPDAEQGELCFFIHLLLHPPQYGP
jgi:hypothetical protein